MKLKNILMTAVVALTTVASVNAATTSYNDGDLMLGIRKAGTSVDYLVDLGQASSFDFSHTINFAVSGIAADLSATYGSDWHSQSAITYSVFGTLSNNNDTGEQFMVYTTNPNATSFNSQNHQGTISGYMSNVGGLYDGQISTANDSVGIWQTTGGTLAVYANYQPGGSLASGKSFATWTSNEAAVNSALNFDVLSEGWTGSGTGTAEPGTFSLDASGDLSYTVQAVPEPSTYAMVGLGALGMLVMLRRRSVQA